MQYNCSDCNKAFSDEIGLYLHKDKFFCRECLEESIKPILDSYQIEKLEELPEIERICLYLRSKYSMFDISRALLKVIDKPEEEKSNKNKLVCS